MTAWIFGAKLEWLSLTAGCVKLQIPASSNRVRRNGERVPVAVLVPVSIWFIVIMLKPATYTSQKHSQISLCMVIDDSTEILLIATNQSTCINWPQFYVPDDVPCALWPFAAGCVKLQLPSLRRNAWHHNGGKYRRRRSIWWWFWKYFVVNTCNITFFSHVIIGIDHGRLGVTATTPSWFVVRWGRPSSCALGMSRRRTTNHLGVVAVTPSRPWSIP